MSYDERLCEFLRCSTITEKAEEWMDENHKKIDELNKARKILSVGSGTGSIDIHLSKILPRVSNYYDCLGDISVDPSKELTSMFKKRVENLENSKTKFVFHDTTIEEFVQNPDVEHVDVALFTHSLQYIIDKVIVLEKIIDIATITLIIVQAEDEGMYLVQSRFGDEVLKRRAIHTNNKLDCNYEILGEFEGSVLVSNPSDLLLGFLLETETCTEKQKLQTLQYFGEKHSNGNMPQRAAVIRVMKKLD